MVLYGPGIEAFLAISKTMNISQAAEQLNLAQSTVSKRLKDLEDDLGVSLIERGQGAKSLLLTPAGEEFLRIALQWHSLYSEAYHLKAHKQQLSLSIGSLSSLNYALFSPLFHALSMHTPKLRLSVATSHSVHMYDLIERKQVDVAFTLLERVHATIHVEKWISEPMVLLRPGLEEHYAKNPIHPSELDPDQEVYQLASKSFTIWHDKWWDPLRSNFTFVDNAHMVFSFLKHKEQWAIVPLSVAKMAVSQGCYSFSPLAESPPERIVYKLIHKYPKTSTVASLEIFDHYLNELMHK